MSNEPNDTIFVDPNTDDLDSFTDLLNGKAQEQVEVEEKITPDVVEPVSEDDDPTAGDDPEDLGEPEDVPTDGEDDSARAGMGGVDIPAEAA